MTKRMSGAICAALVIVGASVAQAPNGVPSAPPPASTDWQAPLVAPPGNGGRYADPDGRFWVTAEYLFGWFQGGDTTPLVTTSPAGTARTVAGVFGAPTTTNLFGGNRLNEDLRSGIRLEAGYWFDAGRTVGLDAGFTMLESQASLFSASSDGTTILARPYIDANTHTAQAVLIAFPGSSSGSVDVRASSGNFYMGHLDFTETVCDNDWLRFNAMVGYRYFRYDEGLNIRQTVNPLGSGFVPGTQITSVDNFNTRNEFNGADFGFRTQFFWQSFSVDLLTKLAVGRLQRTIDIEGNTVTTVPGVAPTTQTGGVLALSSNIGKQGNHDLSILPELGVNLCWQARPNLRLRFGYTLLYLHDIARAANQVDITVNPNLFPTAVPNQGGPNRPTFMLDRQDFAIHNFSTGLEFSF
jgi:hypothetical protein